MSHIASSKDVINYLTQYNDQPIPFGKIIEDGVDNSIHILCIYINLYNYLYH